MLREKAERLQGQNLMDLVVLSAWESVHGSNVMIEGL